MDTFFSISFNISQNFSRKYLRREHLDILKYIFLLRNTVRNFCWDFPKDVTKTLYSYNFVKLN